MYKTYIFKIQIMHKKANKNNRIKIIVIFFNCVDRVSNIQNKNVQQNFNAF